MSASHSNCPQCGTAISATDRKTRQQCPTCGRPFNFVVALTRTETLSIPALIPGMPTEPPPETVNVDSISEVPEAAAVADEPPAEEPIVEAMSVDEPVAEAAPPQQPPVQEPTQTIEALSAKAAKAATTPFEEVKAAPAPQQTAPVAKGPFEEAPRPVPVPVPVFVLPQPAPVEVDEDDEDENEDDRRDRRGRRDRRETAKRDPKKRDSGVKVAVLTIVGALALVCLALAMYFIFQDKGKGKDVAKVDPTPVGPPPPKKDDKKKEQPPLTLEQAIKKTKDSTVYIRVHLPGGALASGTGFFAGKPGFIVTNAHVVGYGPYQIRKPEKVEVVVDSGEAGERTTLATIFGLDAEHDLAVLRIEMKDMPPPLSFGKAESLIETQEVIAFGYPFGERFAASVSVNRTTVSRLPRANGQIEKVQLAGGLNPGNSGGPVTNTKGEVIGVSVSGIPSAVEICFAIPAETADRFVDDMLTNGGQIRIGKKLELINEIFNDLSKDRTPKWATLRIPPPAPVAITPAKIDGDSVTVKLPARATAACVGGGGRFVVFHLSEDRQFAIFDVCAGKVVKVLLAPDKPLFAASMDALYVVDAESEKIERWNLTTFAKEGSMPLPVSSPTTAIAIGSASNGPLMVQAQSAGRLTERFLFDVVLGREVKGSRKISVATDKDAGRLRASTDGRTFLQISSKGQAEVIAVTDTGYHEAKAGGATAGDSAVLSGDGQTVFTRDSIYGRGGLPGGRTPGDDGFCLPAVSGPLVLAPVAKGLKQMAVYAGRDRKPLFELPPVPALEAVLDRTKVAHPERHVFFVPAAKALAVLSPDGDSVTLHRLDVDALLEKVEDYVFVTSTPPQAVAGKSFDYRLAVKSKQPATGFQVLSGPPGMVVSDDGRVSWTVPAKFAEATRAALAITGADGKEHRYEFELVPTLPPPE